MSALPKEKVQALLAEVVSCEGHINELTATIQRLEEECSAACSDRETFVTGRAKAISALRDLIPEQVFNNSIKSFRLDDTRLLLFMPSGARIVEVLNEGLE